MTRHRIVARLSEAARTVARTVWGTDTAGELLARLGLPGFATGDPAMSPIWCDPASMLTLKLHHTLLSEGAQEISAALREHGVAHFFAKGIALLGPVYRPGERFLSDIDVYVNPEHRAAALDALTVLHYDAAPDAQQVGPPALRSSLALGRRGPSEMEQLTVDLHWTLDPIERIIPRRDRPVPPRIWECLDSSESLTVPAPEHHAAILAHHLIHTDLLHVRSLIDLAFVFDGLSDQDGAEYLATCKQLRLGRFASLLAQLVADEFGIVRPCATSDYLRGWNGFTRGFTLERWLALAAREHPDDDDVITVPRIRRRLQLVDAGGAKTLFGDLFFPPRAFLAWRWQTHTFPVAVLQHYRQLAAKALPFRSRRARTR